MANLALNYPAGAGASSGRSPIWPSGRIVYNGRRDETAIKARKRKLGLGEAAIGGGSEDGIWMMQRHRIVVQERTPPRRGDGTDTRQDVDVYVLDCANGFGQKGESMDQLNERIGGVFVTGGQIMSEGQREAIALQKGGFQTIPNSGPENIKMGHWVVVSAPDPTGPQPAPPRNDVQVDKILWWTRPFQHGDTLGSVVNAHKILTARGKDAMSEQVAREYSKQFPAAAQFTTGLGRAIETLAMVGIVSAIEAGMVSFNEGGSVAWEARAQQYRNTPEAERGRHIEEIARELLTTDETGGVLKLKRDNGDLQYKPLTVTDKSDTNKTVPFQLHVMDSAFARRPGYRWFQATNRARRTGQPTYNSSTAEMLVMRQQQAIPEVVATIRAADVAAKRRILGLAMSPAKPGQDFDILLTSIA